MADACAPKTRARAATALPPLLPLAGCLLLAGCGADYKPLPPACNGASLAASERYDEVPMVHVYFGCGCFWHMQHGFVMTEMSELCRRDGNITAMASYAGGTRVGEKGICYHNAEGTSDYGEMGHAEVVALRIPESSFPAFAAEFWRLCPDGRRQDVQDTGGEYRTVVGLPGGLDSKLLPELGVGAGSASIVAGNGDEGDTLLAGQVLVYDELHFPAWLAEKFHQFHDDMSESYGDAYNSLSRFAKATKCPGDQAAVQS